MTHMDRCVWGTPTVQLASVVGQIDRRNGAGRGITSAISFA